MIELYAAHKMKKPQIDKRNSQCRMGWICRAVWARVYSLREKNSAEWNPVINHMFAVNTAVETIGLALRFTDDWGYENAISF